MTRAGAPFRPAAAAAHERVAWPIEWGRRFVITVDVEEEFNWSAPLDRRQRSTRAMRAFAPAYRRFAERGIGWTCLADWPVATDDRAIAALAEVLADGRSAVGAQLHAWVNPPHEEATTPATSFPGNLPPALEAAKLDRLTDAITHAWGRRPQIYRAGRYGIGPRTLSLLADRGYRIDSSMRARYDYAEGGGPDFSRIGPHAFRRDGMAELPLTTVFTGRARRWGAGLYDAAGRAPHGRGALARAGLVSRVALTPEDMPLSAALAAIDAALADGVALLVFSFHSPSLEPGHTPYVRDAGDLAAFDRWWDVVLDRLDARGVRPATLDQVLAAAG